MCVCVLALFGIVWPRASDDLDIGFPLMLGDRALDLSEVGDSGWRKAMLRGLLQWMNFSASSSTDLSLRSEDYSQVFFHLMQGLRSS